MTRKIQRTWLSTNINPAQNENQLHCSDQTINSLLFDFFPYLFQVLSPVVHVKFPIKTKNDETTLLIEVLLTCRKVEPSDWWIIKLVWKQRSTDPSFRLLVVCGACARVYVCVRRVHPCVCQFSHSQSWCFSPCSGSGESSQLVKSGKKKLRYINLYASAAVTSSGPGTCGFAVSLPGALNDECWIGA